MYFNISNDINRIIRYGKEVFGMSLTPSTLLTKLTNLKTKNYETNKDNGDKRP